MIDPDQLQDDDSALYSCRRCQRKLMSLEDVEHGDCYGAAEQDKARQREAIRRLHRDTARREAIRRLHRDTARLLRQTGHPEEAAWHDVEASR